MADLVEKKVDDGQEEDDEEEYAEIPDSEKTPVTIITGFLGAGKTTLVNYILKEQNTWKICVVENEFGEVSIDNDLVKENLAAKEDIIMMDNGCVCCSVRGDLVRAFSMLVSRRKEFDAIIIETTGLADPSPIVFTFNSNSLIQDNYRIDSVVCLVDAKHINIHLDDIKPEGNINEAEHQIAFADRILLNKLDLVSKEELEDVEDRIKSMNSFATLIRTERSRAPLDQVLGLNSFSLEKVVEVDPTIMDEEEEEEEVDAGHVHDEHCNHESHDSGHVHDEHCKHEEDHSHGHGHGHDSAHKHDDGHAHGHGHESAHKHEDHGHGHDAGHVHDEHCSHDHKEHDHGHDHAVEKPLKKKKKTHNLSLVSSVGFTIVGLLDVALFNTFMTTLLQAKAADLYRTKGVLAFAGQGDVKFVFQGVHEQINFGPSEHPWGEGVPRDTKMVFIGKNLDYEYLKESLLQCCEDPATAVLTMHKR
ncbi:CobW/HypB/UreG, nucleotide-binding domain-containing protein [Ochromonadaceae sp. CCMP2298]|nr:CobW/HypB/UreG, nucleotide-binding domain-containing protein [Ochromonadaceae sp. CCMP2298]|mmetsp:Transcript_4213/g.9250  ORF Transcript_4213/g.9250 Transcript_4213/m.9250 type:complete len:475 (+) Transcript_4213:23-1447(+)